jgi:hypothetical protein
LRDHPLIPSLIKEGGRGGSVVLHPIGQRSGGNAQRYNSQDGKELKTIIEYEITVDGEITIEHRYDMSSSDGTASKRLRVWEIENGEVVMVLKD